VNTKKNSATLTVSIVPIAKRVRVTPSISLTRKYAIVEAYDVHARFVA
jgi:hypothetical protein